METYLIPQPNLDSFNYSNQIKKAHQEPRDIQFWETFLNLEHPLENIHQMMDGAGTLSIRDESSGSCKPKTKNVNNYPTKNCLALFKSAHFAYLEKQHINFKDFEVLRVLRKKSGVAKADFVSLYTIKELEGVWSQMFKRKYLYHYLMLSRSFSKQKSIFQDQIKVLEKAYQTKEFASLCVKQTR